MCLEAAERDGAPCGHVAGQWIQGHAPGISASNLREQFVFKISYGLEIRVSGLVKCLVLVSLVYGRVLRCFSFINMWRDLLWADLCSFWSTFFLSHPYIILYILESFFLSYSMHIFRYFKFIFLDEVILPSGLKCSPLKMEAVCSSETLV